MMSLTELLTIALCALAVGTSFLALYSPSESWDGLITRAAASAFAMLVAALAVSTRLRAMITVELRMTLRSFMARHGV